MHFMSAYQRVADAETMHMQAILGISIQGVARNPLQLR